MIESLLNYKLLFWIISVIITLIGYYIYIKDIYFWQNKPHFYSWLVWGIITIMIYIIQVEHNSWSGSWVALITGIMWFIIAIISLKKGTKDIIISDIITLLLALLWILLRYYLELSIYSVILFVLIDVFLYYKIFIKSIFNYSTENYKVYLLPILKYLFAIFALNTITLETSLYLMTNTFLLLSLVLTIVFLKLFIIKEWKR